VQPLLPIPLPRLTAVLAGQLLREGRLTRAFLHQIQKHNTHIQAFITITAERALEDAHRADEELKKGTDRGPLHGIPYALKDIFNTKDILTTCNSKQMQAFTPAEDCAVEKKLRNGGAVLLGKLNTHEFALGGPGLDLPFPPARNPWNTACFTGASSSGSGAAVAAGMTLLAIGSDTSGSVRSPASHCGVVGLKPTFGLVSMAGAFPLSHTLDHCGVLTRTVPDAALALQVIAGYDAADPASVNVPVPDYSVAGINRLQNCRIGFPEHYYRQPGSIAPVLLNRIRQLLEKLKEQGAIVEAVTLPAFEWFNACGRIIMTAEGYAVHKQALQNHPEQFGRYTYQRLLPGAAITPEQLAGAHRLKNDLANYMQTEIFTHYDAIVLPACLFPAPALTAFTEHWPPPKPVVATHTIPFNITGNPVISVPIGLSENGLPLGLQIAGRLFDETALFQLVSAIEKTTGMYNRLPEI
jgi:aspartyl-tRNA(Asn)/glutamyl-tRNA(Gln) amidotransferase subunit A